MIESIRHIFIDETNRQLDAIELELQSEFGVTFNKKLAEKVFLAMHSIKGTSPMFGFNKLPSFIIPIEKTFDRIRKDEIILTTELKEKTEEVVKIIKNVLVNNNDIHITEGEDEKALITFFKNLST